MVKVVVVAYIERVKKGLQRRPSPLPLPPSRSRLSLDPSIPRTPSDLTEEAVVEFRKKRDAARVEEARKHREDTQRRALEATEWRLVVEKLLGLRQDQESVPGAISSNSIQGIIDGVLSLRNDPSKLPPSVLAAAPHLERLMDPVSAELLEQTFRIRTSVVKERAVDQLIDKFQQQRLPDSLSRGERSSLIITSTLNTCSRPSSPVTTLVMKGRISEQVGLSLIKIKILLESLSTTKLTGNGVSLYGKQVSSSFTVIERTSWLNIIRRFRPCSATVGTIPSSSFVWILKFDLSMRRLLSAWTTSTRLMQCGWRSLRSLKTSLRLHISNVLIQITRPLRSKEYYLSQLEWRFMPRRSLRTQSKTWNLQ